jgi:hypothetical protein
MSINTIDFSRRTDLSKWIARPHKRKPARTIYENTETGRTQSTPPAGWHEYQAQKRQDDARRDLQEQKDLSMIDDQARAFNPMFPDDRAVLADLLTDHGLPEQDIENLRKSSVDSPVAVQDGRVRPLRMLLDRAIMMASRRVSDSQIGAMDRLQQLRDYWRSPLAGQENYQRRWNQAADFLPEMVRVMPQMLDHENQDLADRLVTLSYLRADTDHAVMAVRESIDHLVRNPGLAPHFRQAIMQTRPNLDVTVHTPQGDQRITPVRDVLDPDRLAVLMQPIDYGRVQTTVQELGKAVREHLVGRDDNPQATYPLETTDAIVQAKTGSLPFREYASAVWMEFLHEYRDAGEHADRLKLGFPLTGQQLHDNIMALIAGVKEQRERRVRESAGWQGAINTVYNQIFGGPGNG